MSKKLPLLSEFVYFVNERWAIHQRRLAGEQPPWTKDPILQTYRFTNVRREDDRVTIWLHKEWLWPHERAYDTVVFAMCLARLVNLPSMLVELGYPLRWSGARFVKLMEARTARGERAYNGAYMINAVGATKEQSKARYLAEYVLQPLWAARKDLGEVLRNTDTLEGLYNKLITYHGFGGGFMSAQVIADVKHTPAGYNATDWLTFAHSGPGSRRGLNWVCGRHVMDHWNEEEWKATLLKVRALLLPKLPTELQSLDAQNVQNCLCEFSKYCKTKFDGLRPKKYFKPSEEPYTGACSSSYVLT